MAKPQGYSQPRVANQYESFVMIKIDFKTF